MGFGLAVASANVVVMSRGRDDDVNDGTLNFPM